MEERSETPPIAVVNPVSRRGATIARVIADFSAALPNASIYVFDKDSSDGTGEVARAAGALVVRSPRRGKGMVVRHIRGLVRRICG